MSENSSMEFPKSYENFCSKFADRGRITSRFMEDISKNGSSFFGDVLNWAYGEKRSKAGKYTPEAKKVAEAEYFCNYMTWFLGKVMEDQSCTHCEAIRQRAAILKAYIEDRTPTRYQGNGYHFNEETPFPSFSDDPQRFSWN
jgi:hypothetical protein